MNPRKVLRHTLVSEGTTDANLVPIIEWTLKEKAGVSLAQGTHAEFWRLPNPPGGLSEKITKALVAFPCDVLFVHRDADTAGREDRLREIHTAFIKARASGVECPVVALIPVRMLEAWLCLDESAIRKAAGNPNGDQPLSLPDAKRIEQRPDPKSDLHWALRAASGLRGRRLKKFDTAQAFWRIVDYIEDFSPLRQLPSYQAFEATVRRMGENQWQPGFYG
ncbi:MAG: hypothetical protein H7A45_01710 [Verrucomicrobiales bacterium]|nr:hypothetical protein [Verrucomicrobiales bacterium]